MYHPWTSEPEKPRECLSWAPCYPDKETEAGTRVLLLIPGPPVHTRPLLFSRVCKHTEHQITMSSDHPRYNPPHLSYRQEGCFLEHVVFSSSLLPLISLSLFVSHWEISTHTVGTGILQATPSAWRNVTRCWGSGGAVKITAQIPRTTKSHDIDQGQDEWNSQWRSLTTTGNNVQ